MLGYDASTLQPVNVFVDTPNGSQGGIWMAGGAPVINDEGDFFVATGNGTFDANLDGGIDYGDSLLKLGPTDSSNFGVVDYFTPYNQMSTGRYGSRFRLEWCHRPARPGRRYRRTCSSSAASRVRSICLMPITSASSTSGTTARSCNRSAGETHRTVFDAGIFQRT